MLGSSKVVGVYINSKAIFVAHIQMLAGRAKIVGSGEIFIPDISSSKEADKPMANSIKTALTQARAVPVKSVYLTIPAETSMIRSFELPFLSKKEQKDAVRFEARKYVPFDLKELYYDYETFPSADKKKMSVVFFAAKKALVDDLVSLLQLGNIKINAIELSSHSIIRAFNYEMTHRSEEVYAIIQAVDEKTAEIIVARKQSVLVTRHVAFTKLPDSLGGMDLAPFISEIRLSFDYFSENFKNEKIGRLYIRTSGNKDSLNRLHETLKQEFALPVEITSTPSYAADGPRSPGMITAFGLALRGVWNTSAKKIDLSPPKKSQSLSVAIELPWEEEKKVLKDLAIKEVFVVAVVFLLAFLLLSHQLNTKKAQLGRVMAAYPKAQTANITAPIADLAGRQAALNAKAEMLFKLIEKRIYVTAKLSALARNVPADVRLTGLTYDEIVGQNGLMSLNMHIEGQVPKAEVIATVNKLSAALRKDKDFMQGVEEVKVSSISSANRTFFLECVGAKRE